MHEVQQEDDNMPDDFPDDYQDDDFDDEANKYQTQIDQEYNEIEQDLRDLQFKVHQTILQNDNSLSMTPEGREQLTMETPFQES